MPRKLLNEGSRDNALAVFLPLFQKRGIEVSISQLKQFLLNKFVNEAGIHALSERSNYYLSGVARYYFHGDLTTNKTLNAFDQSVKDDFRLDVCKKLNSVIMILRDAYIDTVGTKFEQPEDFGNLSLAQLLRKYNRKIAKTEEQPKELPHEVGDYTYEILYSFDDARKYERYTHPGAWCITYGKQHFDGYVKRLGIHYVVFKKNGFENIERKVGPNFTKEKPHDEYGNSLICVLQRNDSPEPEYITSRWNHGSYNDNTQGTEADHAYTTSEFLNVIGSDASILTKVYNEWKDHKTSPRREKDEEKKRAESLIRYTKYLQMLINNGYRMEELFTKSEPFGQYQGYSFLTFEFNNANYTVLSRGKKLLYDIYVWPDRNGYELYDKVRPVNTRFVAVENYNAELKYNLRKTAILDTKTGKPVVIDGHSSFFISDGISHGKHWDATQNPKFAVFALSRSQLAIVETETMKPIRIDNGDVWFEEIKTAFAPSSAGIPSLFNNGCALCIYDSSARKKYVFSAYAKKMTPLPDGFDNFYFDCGSGDLSILYPPQDFSMVKIFDAYHGRFFSFEKQEYFNNPDIMDNVIIFRKDNENIAVDTRTNEVLKINGVNIYDYLYSNLKKGDIVSDTHFSGLGRGYITFSKYNPDDSSDMLLYNELEHEFFELGGCYWVRKYVIPSKSLYTVNGVQISIPKPEEMKEYIARKEQELKEDVKRNFFNLLDRISAHQTIY